MLTTIAAVVAVTLAILLAASRTRQWIVEAIKELSDRFMIFLLRATSRFGSELSEEGKLEQQRWREQQLRNLRGLALRAKEKREKASER